MNQKTHNVLGPCECDEGKVCRYVEGVPACREGQRDAIDERSPVGILNRIGARVDALPAEDAEVVINLALRLQHIVKGAGTHGVLALSLCSASITAGLQLEAERDETRSRIITLPH